MIGDDDWSDYESGPFCRHWGHPSDCDERCVRCGHKCGQHYGEDCHERIEKDDGSYEECPCNGWIKED